MTVGVLVAVATVGVGPGAARSSVRNTNLVADTVYDGVFAATQTAGGWSDAEFQFAVSAAGRITFDPIGPECGPTDSFPPSSTDVEGDAFTSYSSPGTDYKVTLKGQFEPDGVAKGTGLLNTETIQGQSCVELDDWTAHALPKGTSLCPDVDSGLASYTTVTGMTCAEAEDVYEAGLKYMKDHDDDARFFESPGWDCGGMSDPVVGTVCTHGDQTFRLPAG